MITETEALIQTMEIYSQTNKFVSQGFYQALCTRAAKRLKIKSERIKNLEVVIEHQKETIRNQGSANEKKHNILCGIKEEIDEYFMKG